MKSRFFLLFSLLTFIMGIGTAQMALAAGRGQFKLYMYNKADADLTALSVNFHQKTAFEGVTLQPYLRLYMTSLDTLGRVTLDDWEISFKYKGSTYHRNFTTGLSDDALMNVYFHIEPDSSEPARKRALKLTATLAEAGGKTVYQTSLIRDPSQSENLI